MLRAAASAFALLGALLTGGAGHGAGWAGEDPPSVSPVRLSDVKEMIRRDSGNVILVNAWASWCKPCQEEMPGLLRLRSELHGRPFRVMLISIDDPDSIVASVQPALRRLGVKFPTFIFRDSSDEAFINGMNPKWNGALPATFLYDREGRQVDLFVGGRSYEKFRDAVEKILGP